MTDASHQIYEQKSELEAMNSELSAMNEGLRDMVDEQTQKIMEHERLLVQQSKMAAMGDMIGAIAHQWRQPLNALAIAIQDIKFAHESGELDDVYIANTVKSSMGMINFMSGTIEDFRNFFKPAKEKSYFSAASVVKSVLSILGTQLENHDIKLTVEGGDFKIFGYAGELSQVVLNLISNSKDAILAKK
jgi:C4-dicarboxylate-specific signal transduction histidine kinase